MEQMVFGILALDATDITPKRYIVWTAPAPDDETEPEYVKPLAATSALCNAQDALHAYEKAYAEQRAAAGTPEEPIIDTDEDFGSAVALP